MFRVSEVFVALEPYEQYSMNSTVDREDRDLERDTVQSCYPFHHGSTS